MVSGDLGGEGEEEKGPIDISNALASIRDIPFFSFRQIKISPTYDNTISR